MTWAQDISALPGRAKGLNPAFAGFPANLLMVPALLSQGNPQQRYRHGRRPAGRTCAPPHTAICPPGRICKNQFVRAATSPSAKTAYAVVGTVGLAALAIAIFGPKRFQREILAPVQNKVSDQAAQLWADSKPLREQIGRLFDGAQSQSGREKLVRSFQCWIRPFSAPLDASERRSCR